MSETGNEFREQARNYSRELLFPFREIALNIDDKFALNIKEPQFSKNRVLIAADSSTQILRPGIAPRPPKENAEPRITVLSLAMPYREEVRLVGNNFNYSIESAGSARIKLSSQDKPHVYVLPENQDIKESLVRSREKSRERKSTQYPLYFEDLDDTYLIDDKFAVQLDTTEGSTQTFSFIARRGIPIIRDRSLWEPNPLNDDPDRISRSSFTLRFPSMVTIDGDNTFARTTTDKLYSLKTSRPVKVELLERGVDVERLVAERSGGHL